MSRYACLLRYVNKCPFPSISSFRKKTAGIIPSHPHTPFCLLLSLFFLIQTGIILRTRRKTNNPESEKAPFNASDFCLSVMTDAQNLSRSLSLAPFFPVRRHETRTLRRYKREKSENKQNEKKRKENKKRNERRACAISSNTSQWFFHLPPLHHHYAPNTQNLFEGNVQLIRASRLRKDDERNQVNESCPGKTMSCKPMSLQKQVVNAMRVVICRVNDFFRAV